MSSHTNLPGSKAIKSEADPQGTYRPDPMFRMHQMEPGTQQSPDRTIKQLKVMLNPPGAGKALMAKQAAIWNRGKVK